MATQPSSHTPHFWWDSPSERRGGVWRRWGSQSRCRCEKKPIMLPTQQPWSLSWAAVWQHEIPAIGGKWWCASYVWSPCKNSISSHFSKFQPLVGNVSCCSKMRCLFWQFYLYLETTDSHLWAKLCIPLVACFHFWSPPSQDCLFVSLACTRVLSSKMHHCRKNVSHFVSLQAPSWYRFPAGVTALSLSLSLRGRLTNKQTHYVCVVCGG